MPDMIWRNPGERRGVSPPVCLKSPAGLRRAARQDRNSAQLQRGTPMTRYFVAVVLAVVAGFAGQRCAAQGPAAKTTFEGHKGRVFSVEITTDGALVASGS